jgi:chorismate lyase/3-hydroxybenzoate synthase
MSLDLNYFNHEELDAYQKSFEGKILGAIAFGTRCPASTSLSYPWSWVDMPVLGGDSIFEVWSSEQAALCENNDGILSARNDELIFGCLQTEQSSSLDSAADLAYRRIFDLIDNHKYRHLLRVWHYFPQINVSTDGLERYKRFSVGRHDAFVAKGRKIAADAPAACAVGSRSGPLTVYFLATRKTGRPIENPRQISAYHYPEKYGPCSPVFSRAMLMQTKGKALLFISGTASIVEDETLHVGDVTKQIEETIANMRAVMEQAQSSGWLPTNRESDLLLKVYLRHVDHLPIINNYLTKAFGTQTKIIYLQAEICRSDLLLEVEAVCRGGKVK